MSQNETSGTVAVDNQKIKTKQMPGLPKSPQAERIDVVNGEITGLS